MTTQEWRAALERLNVKECAQRDLLGVSLLLLISEIVLKYSYFYTKKLNHYVLQARKVNFYLFVYKPPSIDIRIKEDHEKTPLGNK